MSISPSSVKIVLELEPLRLLPLFSDVVAALARSCVIDSEVVACDTRGLPDFHALHFLRDGREVCVWAFDLLYLDAKDVRGLSLVERKFLLAPRGSRVDGL